MDIDNKFIHANPIGNIKGKPAWAIVNNKSNSDIACVSWYPMWKRYVMVTDQPAAFDVSCMESIISLIKRVSFDG